MHLAINYSHPAAKLVQTGKINIDFFKAPDWTWLVSEAQTIRPVAVHFTLEAGNASLGHVDWKAVENLAQVTATPYINLHLDSKREHFPYLSVDTTDPADVKQVFDVLLSDVTSVVERDCRELTVSG
jgi:hypothetical protein